MKIKIENSDVTFSANVRSATIGGGGEQVLENFSLVTRSAERTSTPS